ncbi:hypothetical protein T10_8728 [Trichinella papuae]|uniref:Uncharacterized protein n=1 Tax=Trichinella papuae TaxID=268474 RepID=A0A0V1M0Z6_9BILA|nr:hypothetical protein T10_8728 [Trichinella papuae]
MYIEWRCKCVDGCRKGKANAIISMDKAISGKSTCLNRSRQFTWRVKCPFFSKNISRPQANASTITICKL